MVVVAVVVAVVVEVAIVAAVAVEHRTTLPIPGLNIHELQWYLDNNQGWQTHDFRCHGYELHCCHDSGLAFGILNAFCCNFLFASENENPMSLNPSA